jgi:hypothetical protein
MKRISVLFPLIGLALSGCVGYLSQSATEAAEQRARAAYIQCNDELRDGILKNYRQTVACARPKVLAAYEENAYPNMDLVELDLWARERGAERIDSGNATPQAVNRDIAELERRITIEQQRRLDARRATTGGAAPIPLARLLDGLTAITGTGEKQPALGQNCFKVGTFTHCQ